MTVPKSFLFSGVRYILKYVSLSTANPVLRKSPDENAVWRTESYGGHGS